MGAWLSKCVAQLLRLCAALLSPDTPASAIRRLMSLAGPRDVRILMLGLDAAGKSTSEWLLGDSVSACSCNSRDSNAPTAASRIHPNKQFFTS